MFKNFLVIIFLITSSLYGTIISVPDDFSTIQEAINSSVEGDSVIVANGTYYESIDFLGKEITVASQYIYSHDPIDIENTIIDANQEEYHVVKFVNEETRNSRLIGFSITGGNANGGEGFDRGGGILCDDQNVAPPHTNPYIEACYIYNNSATAGGGIAIQAFAGNVLIKDCKIFENAAQGGGGIYLGSIHEGATIENCKIYANSAETGGGIFHLFKQSIFDNCTIYSNTASVTGSALAAKNSIILNKTLFYNNNVDNVSMISIENIGTNPLPFQIFNCTIVNNEPSTNTTISVSGNIEVIILNSILDNNNLFEIVANQDGGASHIEIANCDIIGGFEKLSFGADCTYNWDESNINIDPLFIDSNINNYSLDPTSPCIDSGITQYEYEGNLITLVDEGTYFGVSPDIGFYEYDNTGISNDLDAIEIQSDLSTYPNPFNPSTTIAFSLSESGMIDISIYNVKGQKVKQLINNHLLAGKHCIEWNGENTAGDKVSSGVYFYFLNVDGKTKAVNKCLMLK